MTTEEKGLAPRGEDQMAIPIAPPEYSDMHPGDVLPPFINIVQGTSEKGTPGKFRRADTEEEYESLNVVPLRVQKNRTYWGPGAFSRDRSPECFSLDGNYGAMVNGDGEPTAYPGQDCMTCPMRTDSPWRDKDMCKGGYMVYLFNVETFETYGMRLTGAATPRARKFNAGSILQRTILKLTTARKTNEYGTWYELIDEVGRIVTPAEHEVVEAEAKLHANIAASPIETTATAVDNSRTTVAPLQSPAEAQAEEEWRTEQAAAKAKLEGEQGEMHLEGDDSNPAKVQVGDGPDVEDVNGEEDINGEESINPGKWPW